MTDYMPPRAILELFENEKLAESLGRAAFLGWTEKLDLKQGDRVYVPSTPEDERGGWYDKFQPRQN